ncbi:hypothetical protein ADUPG1_012547 [Aduncisulcus paluster]|uniref:Uncharacterized protein n=1 Tax=Aduncisulcus paluster TaxID=2918883 RepID=A0ABQ5K4L6_9EUKA|nr:hypothetical protein ADUPG1_012547 [Aduncisulcus paluster]
MFSILSISTDIVDPLCTIVCPKISTLLSKMFILGLSEKLEDSFVEDILQTCRNIAFAKDDPTKNSLLSILLPHILPWMEKYPDKKFFFLWMNILKNITLDKDNIDSDKIVLHNFGITFDDEGVSSCLCFFGNLSCIPSQAIEVHDCIKDGLLDSWFEMVKRKKSEGEDAIIWGVISWSKLISMLSTVPYLVPQLSPKYDTNIEWCEKNECLIRDYTKYLGNCYPSLKKHTGFVESISQCSDSESSSKLYHKHREDILSVFLTSQTKSEVEAHRREIVLCVQYLDLLINHFVLSRNHVHLPISDLVNLVDTFIDHLSRVEEVLGEDIDKEYCSICLEYTYKVELYDSFLPKILSTFHRILERGSKKQLDDSIVTYLLLTLGIISISSFSTRSSILTLIKPYVKDWLRIYKDGLCHGEYAYILSNVTLSIDDESPDISMCSEAWPLFHPILDLVKKEFIGDNIMENDHENVIFFFSNLCCDPSHALEIYDNVKDLLDSWFEVAKRKNIEWGMRFWFRLISMLSTVPSIIPHLSPKYDNNMQFCEEKWPSESIDQYVSNISPFVASSYSSLTFFDSIPMVSLLPSIETSLYPEKDGYSYASHVYSVMKLHPVPYSKNRSFCYHDVISGKEMRFHHIIKVDGLSSHESITHSSLIKYTPPLHMLVQMSFDEERSLRQSVYDLIERTGGGVEAMFEQGSSCYKEYDQEEWRKGMEEIIIEDSESSRDSGKKSHLQKREF